MPGEQRFPPDAVFHVPGDRRGKALVETVLRRPPQFGVELRKIDRVAEVVAGPVGNESHELAMLQAGARARPVERIADRVDHIDIAPLGIAADIVGLAHTAAFQHQRERARMIVDEQPVAHVLPGPVDRHRLAGEALDDRQGDELFRQLTWPVIVRTVRDQHRQPVSVPPCPHQVV